MTESLDGPVPRGFREWWVDVNSNKPIADRHWKWLADHGCAGVILRVASGGKLDETFHGYAGQVRTAGLRLGAYGYLEHGGSTVVKPGEQARFWAQQCQHLRPELFAVDIENGRGRRAWVDHDRPGESALTALAQISERLGITPHLYTCPSFWARHLTGVAPATPLWLARYPVIAAGHRPILTAEELSSYVGHRPVDLWQYGGGPLDGKPGSPRVSRSVRR